MHAELLSVVLAEVCARSGVSPADVDDIAVGNVLQPGGGATVGRIAAFEAGFPPHTCVVGTLVSMTFLSFLPIVSTSLLWHGWW